MTLLFDWVMKKLEVEEKMRPIVQGKKKLDELEVQLEKVRDSVKGKELELKLLQPFFDIYVK